MAVANISLNIYSLLLLSFIYIHATIHTEKKQLQHMLFKLMVQVTMMLLVVDILSRFDGNPGTFYSTVNQVGNFLIYLLSPVLPLLWLLYVQYQVFHREKISRLWVCLFFTINAANTILLVLSRFYGWFYYIDAENVYHRGRLFWLPASITVVLMLAAFALIVIKRKNIEKKYLFSLAFFPVPPFICVMIQIVFYGMSFILNGVALSLLIVFFYIQNSNMNTDYLTGVYNRKKLETYMKEKVNSSSENKTFSAILIDLDNFKSINDTYGHSMGDDALKASAILLKNCLKPTDFVARYGGDEFYIILDESDRGSLNATVRKIESGLEKHNSRSELPYQLGFSMGYAVYDYHSHLGVEKFQKQIDGLMYKNKGKKGKGKWI